MQEKQDIAGRCLGASVHLARAPLWCDEKSNAWSSSYQVECAIATSAIDDNHFMDSWNGQDAFHLSYDA